MPDELIDRAIKEGVFELNGYRYVCDMVFLDHGIIDIHVKRISLDYFDRQYEIELKTADEIIGWEEIYYERRRM